MFQTFIRGGKVVDLADELHRARRIALSLNDPDDLRILESYIAELEVQLARNADARVAAQIHGSRS